MDSTKNKKQTERDRGEGSEECSVEIEMLTEAQIRGHSRRGCASSHLSDDAPEGRSLARAKRRKTGDLEVESIGAAEKLIKEKQSNEGLKQVYDERLKLEEFLFNENNKITKGCIKFILDKWSILESKLQQQILENEVLKTKEMYKTPKFTYAHAASRSPGASSVGDSSESYKRKGDCEVLLIKPMNEDTEKRNNDEIKNEIIKKLKKVESKLKVKNIRQMKKKGMVLEVQSGDDVEMIKNCDLDKIGLKVEKPKKLSPSIIIYDEEKDHKVEEIREHFINKNFVTESEIELNEIREKVNFVHSFKTRDGNRLNWIVQIPSSKYRDLLNKGRVFMAWRAYKIKEYYNTVRCFKCHGFSNIAKVCNVSDQICEFCGSKDHAKDKCDLKDRPKCVNCIRAKRKETSHNVRNRDCPEFLKYLEIYKSKIQ